MKRSLAIVLGLVFHNTVGTPTAFKPGVVFSMRRVLRFAIILLGLQLSLLQLVEVGGAGLGIILLGLPLFMFWRGQGANFAADGDTEPSVRSPVLAIAETRTNLRSSLWRAGR